jgi:glycerol-3-phosphate acyltransferase PlsY
MSIGTYLGYIGGALAVVSGTVSHSTQKPLIAYLTGISPIEGSILVWTGVIAMIGGLMALYFSYKGNGLYTIVGGILGLTAPCGLSVLAAIGGYLMLREGAKGG